MTRPSDEAVEAALRKLAGRRVVASISGGKDSAALSLHLRELGIDHDRVFMDTGWEHPKTYEYLRGELTRVLGPITEVRGPLTMPELIRKRTGFPGSRTRFCTTELKVLPMQRHLRAAMDAGADVVNAIGVRRAESQARAASLEWEWSDTMDCDVWRPLVEWSVEDVIAIHKRHGLAPNPLYLAGFSRVGCFPCIHASKKEIAMAAEAWPERIDEIRALEAEVRARSNADPAPAFFTLRARGTAAKVMAPIDEVLRWSRTARGSDQFDMFAADPGNAGCLRWGMCETSATEAAQAVMERDTAKGPTP